MLSTRRTHGSPQRAGAEPHGSPVPQGQPSLTLTLGRGLLAALIVVAVVATTLDTASRTPINPFNFFGYFTVQSNILMAVIWAGCVVAASAKMARLPRAFAYARGCVTTYIVIVGIVYALLLAPLGAAGGVPLPWANVVLHIVTPIAALLDWLLTGSEQSLRWRRLPIVLAYPLVWLAVVLVRGATDGWVPYPFLDPATGYGSITVVAIGIAVATLAIGALVFARSHRGVKVAS
ncbi:hypothetical protein JOF28_002104 [Leucobacter exalbidus]|uniref:FAR-17a/AIG1-like protein n=1 Tax=Leucobacter exalbidus TaxID=662960 RepID=A0A940PMV8_9MICO|nr:Pr6Pr family membrane protein [Leucobacter exalbidus]MBP1326872.1 hypothetical protein [Leucobacter exalbidus]